MNKIVLQIVPPQKKSNADEDNSLKANDVLKILKEKVAFLSGT